MRACPPLVVLFSCMLVAAPSQGGRRTLAFTPDAVQLAPGVLEVEQWFWGRGAVDGVSGASSGWLWFGPVYGVTERFEVAVPWQANITREATNITSFGVEGRYAFFDPTDDMRFFRPQLRIGYQQNFTNPDNGSSWLVPWITAELVGTIGSPRGTHLSFDIGLATDLKTSDKLALHELGAGFMAPVAGKLLAGAEYRHQITLTSGPVGDRRWFFLGPSAAYAHGALWASASFLIGAGEHVPRIMPRLALGFAF